MKTGTDAFGRALLDWVRGGTDPEVIERDDGFTEVGAGPEGYLARFQEWPLSERKAIQYVRGRIIDVGCGAGRVPLYLQDRGFEVVGMDASTLAARAVRMRGVRRVWCTTIDRLAPQIGSFDTIILFGNNFGIFGTPQRAQRMLKDWAVRMPPGSRILAQSTNPYCGAPTLDRPYYRRNQRRGLMPGQTRLRYRYRNFASSWFPWLFVSRREMRMLLDGTGWYQSHIIGGPSGQPYVAILQKH
jgi:SAM-dependent methyltransferase